MATAVVEALLKILQTNLKILQSTDFTEPKNQEEEQEEEEEEKAVDSFDWSEGPSVVLKQIVEGRLESVGGGKKGGRVKFGVVVCSTVHCYNTLRTLLEDRVIFLFVCLFVFGFCFFFISYF